MTLDYREFVPAEILHRLDHDWEFLEEMVSLFPEQQTDGVMRLQSALDRRNAAELKEAAHRFKGSVSILSTGRLYDLLKTIEYAPEPELLATGATLLPEVCSASEALRRELDHFLQTEFPHAGSA